MGRLPKSIGMLKNLQHLELVKAMLVGTIPVELFDAVALKVLELRQNPDLVGSIPREIRKLVCLERLVFYDTGLSGPVPSEIQSLPSLAFFITTVSSIAEFCCLRTLNATPEPRESEFDCESEAVPLLRDAAAQSPQPQPQPPPQFEAAPDFKAAEFEAAPPIASPPQPTETMLVNGVQVTIPNEDDIDPDLDRYWYFYFQEKKKKKIPRVPNEVFLNIVQYLPIDNTLHQALRGLYFVFGFDRDLITLNYVKRHWLRHPPHFRVQWMRLPPLYRCHFIILQILRANKFPGSRTNIIQSYGLGYGVPPSSVGRIILKDPQLSSDTKFLATVLLWAVYKKYPALVDLLFTNFNVGNEALLVAANDGNWSLVQSLLSYPEHVDPSTNENQCLQLAVVAGKENIVALLLADDRLNPAYLNNVILDLAVNHPKVLHLLLQDKRIQALNENVSIV
ncbi:hypothetical protein HDU79_011454 [Rhizoclosmatium sp. JEL0117]|nr:hypothetical protein HDU79_011454 [Rhizoclosmatium sp. JEL0117]